MILPVAEYRELLEAALRGVGDAGTQARTLFTPASHRRALDPDATVIRGGRGVGKTSWFSALKDDGLRRVAAGAYRYDRLRSAGSLTGYAEALDPSAYPGPATLARLVEKANPFDVWSTVLLTGLRVHELQGLESWGERVEWLRTHPEEREWALAAADREALDQGQLVLVLFDALDRLSADRRETEALIGGILRLALDLRTRTRSLRAKVFIRPDMFGGDQLQFTDASKLTANAADLTWSPTDLFGLLFHLMGNAVDDGHTDRVADLAVRFRAGSGEWHEQDERCVPPPELLGDQRRQRELFEEIAGPYMGTDHRKGRPYTWLPNHLVDGIGQVSPRSFLKAVQSAVEVTGQEHAGHQHPLHWDAIRRGVQKASTTRVQEISEDLPWVHATLLPLKGSQVPIDERDVLEIWQREGLAQQLSQSGPSGRSDESVRTGPRSTEGHELIEELQQLGVMTRRVDRRLDLPDIYRIAFEVGRKGGVPRIRGEVGR